MFFDGGLEIRQETLYNINNAGMMELADVLDSKSSPGNRVRVRPPLPAISFFPLPLGCGAAVAQRSLTPLIQVQPLSSQFSWIHCGGSTFFQ